MNKSEEFEKEVKNNVKMIENDEKLNRLSDEWMLQSMIDKYSYNFRWMGRPIIQYPQDIVAMQEIIWELKPDLIIETGIAHGGSLIYYASLLELIGEGHVLGIDIDIREHNKIEIESHPMFKRITMFEGSSIDKEMVEKVYDFAKDYARILVVLDSNHTEEHVLEECRQYSKLVKQNSYLVVMDTIAEDTMDKIPSDLEHLSRPWGKGNNPKTAVWKFLKENDRFEIDTYIEKKIQITVCPSGYLKCVK